jgi:4-amino-4-deoxy-L-arabinose transferase-like glycosyltransferase
MRAGETYTRTNWRNAPLISHAAFLLSSLVIGWLIYHHVIVPSGPFEWDEAAHALRGLIIAQDVTQRDWVGFLYDSYRQVYWPPAHSWLTGIAFVSVGASVVAARLVSLVIFLIAAWVLYLAALQITGKHREIAALTAAGLFLTCPALVAYAGQSMLEIPGLLCVIVAFLTYSKLGATERRPHRYVWLGLAIVATYFVKSNYGILLILVVATVHIADVVRGVRRPFAREMFFTVLPMAVVFSVWFAYPPKIGETWRFLVSETYGVTEPYSLAGILFYPFAFFRIVGSAWTALVLLGSFGAALRFWHDKNIAFLIALITIQIIIGEVHHNKVDRHIFPAMPAFFLLAGFSVAGWTAFADERRSQLHRSLSWLVIAVTLVVCIRTFLVHLAPSGANADPGVADHIAAVITDKEKTVVIGTMDGATPSPPALDWDLVVDKRLMLATLSGTTVNQEEVEKLEGALRNPRVPAAIRDLVAPVIGRARRPLGLRSVYLGLPSYAAYSQSPAGLVRHLQRLHSNAPFDSAIVMTTQLPDVRFPAAYAGMALEEVGLRRVSAQDFGGGRVLVEVYRR